MAPKAKAEAAPQPQVEISLDAPTGARQEQAPVTQTPPDDAANQSATQTRTFTQSQLDALIADRLSRERSKYGDYADLKKAAAKLQEIEDAQKTETERLQEQLQQATDKMQELSAANARNELQGAVAKIAGQLGAVDPYDANFLLATQAIDPHGDGAEQKIKDSIEAVKAQRPYLFGKPAQNLAAFNPGTSPAGSGARETDAQRRGRIYGGGGSVWEPDVAAKTGGGVYFSPGWDKDIDVGG